MDAVRELVVGRDAVESVSQCRKWEGWMDAVRELVVGRDAVESVSQCRKWGGKYTLWAPCQKFPRCLIRFGPCNVDCRHHQALPD